MLSLDPFSLDRTIAETARLHSRFIEALRAGHGEEHAFELLPPALSRAALSELSAHAAGDPFAAAAAGWLRHLLLEHGAIEARLGVALAYRQVRHPLDAPERGQWTVAEVVANLLSDGARRAGWASALSVGEDFGARRLALLEALAAHRHELGLELAPPLRDAPDAALEFLRATRDAARELRLASLGDLVDRGLGRDVPGAWPSPLSARKLGDWFREGRLLHGLTPQLASLPRAHGAASALRALAAFGVAFHDAGPSTRLPFVVARDPSGLRKQTFGALFALLPLHAAFAERRLEIGRGRFVDYRRALATVVLLGARLIALRARLTRASSEGAAAYRRCFREEVPDALGFELSPRLAGTLFTDEHGERQLVALLAAARRDQLLTERHDEDWFRNPRAIEELRGEIESAPNLAPELEPELVARGSARLAQLSTSAL